MRVADWIRGQKSHRCWPPVPHSVHRSRQELMVCQSCGVVDLRTGLDVQTWFTTDLCMCCAATDSNRKTSQGVCP